MESNKCDRMLVTRAVLRVKGGGLQMKGRKQKAESRRRFRFSIFNFHSLRPCVLTCLAIFFFTTMGYAQKCVKYGYDASGNRISRTIELPKMQEAAADSTETSGAPVMPQEIFTDVLSDSEITIYPNPTRGRLVVKISHLPQEGSASLTLFDMHGRVITKKEPLSVENELDLSHQPAGSYLMQILMDKESTSWKIIKQ